MVAPIRPVDYKATDARRNVHQIDRGAKSGRTTEHDVAIAGITARAGRRAGTIAVRRSASLKLI